MFASPINLLRSPPTIRPTDLRRLPWSWLCIAAGLLLIWPVFLNRAYVPDEIWFRDDASVMSKTLSEQGICRFVTTQDNHLGYGSIYWITYAVLGVWFRKPIVVARFLALGSIVTVAVCAAIYARRTQSRFGWLAVLLWFSFPICWWTGKVTGPETYSLALGTLGAMLAMLEGRPWKLLAAGAALGLAIGIKFTAAPIVLYAVIVAFRQPEARWRRAAALACGLLLGFLLANPFLPFDPSAYYRNLVAAADGASNSDIPCFTPAYVGYLYSNAIWEWDRVYRGGFFNWSLGAPAFALWLLFLWRAKVERATWWAFAAAMICTTAILVGKSRLLGWYWFPMIALVPLVTSSVRAPTSRSLIALALLLLSVNGICAAPLIREQMQAKESHLAKIQDGLQLQADVEQKIAQTCPGISRLVWYVPPGVVQRSTDKRCIDAPGKFVIYQDRAAYLWANYDQFADDLKPGDSACVVMDRSYRMFWDDASSSGIFRSNEQIEIQRASLHSFELVFLHRRSAEEQALADNDDSSRAF